MRNSRCGRWLTAAVTLAKAKWRRAWLRQNSGFTYSASMSVMRLGDRYCGRSGSRDLWLSSVDPAWSGRIRSSSKITSRLMARRKRERKSILCGNNNITVIPQTDCCSREEVGWPCGSWRCHTGLAQSCKGWPGTTRPAPLNFVCYPSLHTRLPSGCLRKHAKKNSQ